MIIRSLLKKSFFLISFISLPFLVPYPVKGAIFSQVYVFGDSLSDTGRFYKATGETIPVSPPYTQEFSNGPLWVKYLQESLGLIPDPSTNFALAGSTTGNINTTIPHLPGVEQQVEGFLADPPPAPNALYVLWAGANDYLGGAQTNPTIPVHNIANYITSLYQSVRTQYKSI